MAVCVCACVVRVLELHWMVLGICAGSQALSKTLGLPGQRIESIRQQQATTRLAVWQGSSSTMFCLATRMLLGHSMIVPFANAVQGTPWL